MAEMISSTRWIQTRIKPEIKQIFLLLWAYFQSTIQFFLKASWSKVDYEDDHLFCSNWTPINLLEPAPYWLDHLLYFPVYVCSSLPSHQHDFDQKGQLFLSLLSKRAKACVIHGQMERITKSKVTHHSHVECIFRLCSMSEADWEAGRGWDWSNPISEIRNLPSQLRCLLWSTFT